MPSLASPQRTLDVMGTLTEILLSAEETSGACTVVRITVPPGWVNPTHIHWYEEESFYVLKGQIEVVVDGKPTLVSEGQSAFGPKRIPHSFANRSEHPALALVTITPGGIDRFFRAVAEMFPPGTPVDGRILDLIDKHGMSAV